MSTNSNTHISMHSLLKKTHVGRSRIYRMIRQRRIPAIKTEKTYIFALSDLPVIEQALKDDQDYIRSLQLQKVQQMLDAKQTARQAKLVATPQASEPQLPYGQSTINNKLTKAIEHLTQAVKDQQHVLNLLLRELGVADSPKYQAALSGSMETKQ